MMDDDVHCRGDDDEQARAGVLHPADRHTHVGRAGRAGRAAAESAGRPGPPAAGQPDRGSAGGEACVCDLNDAFDLTQATISHHLKVLHSAGVLDRDKRGVWVYYAVRPEALTSVATLFDTAALTPA